MAKRKVFIKTDLTVPRVEQVSLPSGAKVIPAEFIPPNSTIVRFGLTEIGGETFDFQQWYGKGIDQITYACQRQIERFLQRQDGEVSRQTVLTYCRGLSRLLTSIKLSHAGKSEPFELDSINRKLIDQYLNFLSDSGVSTTTQKTLYHATKAVLKALARRGLFVEVLSGDEATFPTNPFPGAHRKHSGAKPLSKREKKEFTASIRTAVMPIFSDDVTPTSELLSYALLIVALHVGRNTWPLLEMSRDCLRSHPKDDTLFLMLYKRRGHSTSKVAIKAARTHELQLESMPAVRPTVAGLIKRVIFLSDKLRTDAAEHIKNNVWLYRARGGRRPGEVCTLSYDSLLVATKDLINQYGLVDADGQPLCINISRLRKTFINRIYEILDGDAGTTAVAAGNSVSVLASTYLKPGEESQRNWKFMGVALVQELLANTIGTTERTPVGQCSDPKEGEYAPKNDEGLCMSFFNCLRCRNYVVTGDDLYKLFSFYWRILKERAQISRSRWKSQFAHIIRLIDRDVIKVGLEQGVFKKMEVELARARARVDPHPFWRSYSIVSDLQGLSK